MWGSIAEGARAKEYLKQGDALNSGSKRTWQPLENQSRVVPRATTDFRQRERALCAQQTVDDASVHTTNKRAALMALLEKSAGVQRTSRGKDGQRSREL